MKLRPTARKKNLVVQEMPDEVLVYDMESNKAHCLNQSAATVWRACNGKNTISDIVGEFEAKGRGKVSEDFVWLAIDQLGESSLLDGDIVAKFAGRSRRQVIKTVGLASMVAVPLVASLVAPQNALASVSCACTAGQPAPCNTRPACPSTTTCNASGQCAP